MRSVTERLIPKAPGDKVAYMADWSMQLGDDTIASYTLTVALGTVTLSGQEQFDQFIRFLVAGGANGETAQLSHQIVTVGGQTLARTISLPITAGVTAITPTTATKRTVVDLAFEEIGLAGYEFDATPEEHFSALRRLDVLMAEWRVSSLDVGYNFPASIGLGSLDDASDLPDDALNTVAICLALRIAPAIGKTLSPETRMAMAQGMIALRTRYAVIPEMQLPNSTLRGAGAKPASTWWPFNGA